MLLHTWYKVSLHKGHYSTVDKVDVDIGRENTIVMYTIHIDPKTIIQYLLHSVRIDHFLGSLPSLHSLRSDAWRQESLSVGSFMLLSALENTCSCGAAMAALQRFGPQ